MKIQTLFSLLFLFLTACHSTQSDTHSYTAYTGVTIIDGTGRQPLTNAVLLIQADSITAVGAKAQITIPEGATIINLSGKTIIPGLINSHGHVGDVKGIEGGHYSKENIVDNLSIYARYGVTSVVSLGGDLKEAEPLRHLKDTTRYCHARLFIAGTILTGKTPEEVVAVADSNHLMGVDWMKIRVDDTGNAARYMDLKKIGTLVPGNKADFIILNDNPLTDIRNTRKIHQVFIGGVEVIKK